MQDMEAFKYSMMGIVSQIVLSFFVIWFKNKFVSEEKVVLKEWDWARFIVVPCFSLIAILAVIAHFEGDMTQEQENIILFIVLGLALMNIFVFYLIMDIVKREAKNKQESLILSHAERTEKLYLQEKRQFEELQRQKHEYKNYMSAVYGLLENKNYEKALLCVKEQYGNLGQINRFDTNHAIVNSMFNMKYMEALNRKILMDIRFNDLSAIPLKDTEIISLLGNLLDNALEACEKCTDRKCIIKVKFMLENKQMLLSVSNTWNKELRRKGEKIFTTKKDERQHGYGIENVKAIVERYDGVYVINTEEEFRFVISIPL